MRSLKNRTRWIIAGLSIMIISCDKGNEEKFDSDRWLKSNYRERGRMAGDLYKSGVLTGKNKQETLRLIGPPYDSTGTRFYYVVDFGDTYTYDMIVSFDSSSSEVNSIRFDD